MCESGRSTEAIRLEASVEHYSNEPTDTASSGTSSELKEALCNSAGEILDREVSLRLAAKRRWTSRIRESRLSVVA